MATVDPSQDELRKVLQETAGLLDLTGLMVEVVERADATLADVEHSAETFKKFQKELTPYKQVLDLWVSQYFGNRLAKEFL
ncbi:MAG: hypothetical protein R6T87_06515, partial [Marinobacter sp.]